ncbi:MAG: prephenate dehydrogenase/arogenate dehydrogenase family protein [Syntrophothermus sp.]
MNISIIGLGLIGGSIARSLKKNGTGFTVNAFDYKETLDLALEQHVIDSALSSPAESVKSDFIFLCLPVNSSLEIFRELIPLLNENTIITDVCGVKGEFQNIWDSLHKNGIYIGGHPMTGKEKGGYLNSDPLLFENAVYILTDTNSDVQIKQDFFSVIQTLGARIVQLDPYLHDKVVANVSHLPQLLSVALVNAAAKGSDIINNLDFAAGGFRDMTRIASSSFNIWEPVLHFNRDEILFALENFENEMQSIKSLLAGERFNEIEDYFNRAGISRDCIPKDTKGFISPLFHISVYVKDQPGMISEISTALYHAQINIKDIELLKIREGSGATFRFAFDNETDSITAKSIIINLGFEVS